MADEIIKLIEYLKNEPFVKAFFAVCSTISLIIILVTIFVIVKSFIDFRRRK